MGYKSECIWAIKLGDKCWFSMIDCQEIITLRAAGFSWLSWKFLYEIFLFLFNYLFQQNFGSLKLINSLIIEQYIIDISEIDRQFSDKFLLSSEIIIFVTGFFFRFPTIRHLLILRIPLLHRLITLLATFLSIFWVSEWNLFLPWRPISSAHKIIFWKSPRVEIVWLNSNSSCLNYFR
jgi:hypothetical protein